MKLNHFEIPICPVPASRPRVARYGVYYGKNYSNFKKELKDWFVANKQDFFSERAEIVITFGMKIPESLSKKKKAELDSTPHTKRPDFDNLVKGVLDAMNEVIISDDGIVYDARIRKFWSNEPSIYVEIKGE